MIRVEAKEEVVVLGEALSNGPGPEGQALPAQPIEVREKVDSIIQQWLLDFWLLVTGEDLGGGSPFTTRADGRAVAMVCGGQLQLLGSRLTALGALRSVGIEMG